jgi:serine phosphatase RsbU (regulator of sigma subunit)
VDLLSLGAWGPGSRWEPIVAAPAHDRKLLLLPREAIIPVMTGVAQELEPDAVEALAAAAGSLLEDGAPRQAFAALSEAAGRAVGADRVIARPVSASGDELVARAVHAASSAVAAELEGMKLPARDVPAQEDEIPVDVLPEALGKAAERSGAANVRVYPVFLKGRPAATLELFRAEGAFTPREQMLGRLAAAHLGLAVRMERESRANGREASPTLEFFGEALAAGADETETAEQVVRLATEAVDASGAALWRIEADAPPIFLAAFGLGGRAPRGDAVEQALAALQERPRGMARSVGADGSRVATLPLGEPPVAALQLYFENGAAGEDDLDERLSPFAARAALALRRSRRVGLISLALRRSQTVIGVVSQAIAQLSLTHTLETAVERIAELTGSGHVAIYLREGERLTTAASRGLRGADAELAERLLELALGPFRGRGFVFIEDMRRDARLRGLEAAWEETGVRRVLFIPLVVHDEVIGALGVYKTRSRPYREGEEGLLIALSSQLAVAVQNARLHERSKELGERLERTLDSERRAARQLRGLYEISQSFAESLSLQATLDAVVKSMVELFEVDAAVIRMPDDRGEMLDVRAVHVRDEKLAEAAPRLLGASQPVSAATARRLLRSRRPVVLEHGSLGPDDAHRVLDAFLARGSTAAVLPLATPGEILGTLTLLSLDPRRPLDRETVDAAMTVGGQAALAIDNARLYQQQKDFSETMQRSLLPRELPAVEGLDVGHVYESSARVDVGGDVYDFLILDDGRLAVILGDVTGKGIEAAADMAMAKFSFRALARVHSEPEEFLQRVNEVIVDEIGGGKFITMLYALVDARTRSVACASAGHPAAKVVKPDGTVAALAGRGLALGIEAEQDYEAERAELEPGSTIVLYTDGVVEARRDGKLYGEERLDKVLAEGAGLDAQELAESILADCRGFAGGELGDDCAILCLRLLAAD